jgi:DNA polymerase-3 subunit alpha
MPKFGEKLDELRRFHLGERIIIAHNLAFDLSMIRFELMRLDAVCKFPWPYHGICTVVETLPIRGHRLSLSKLHEYCFGEAFDGAHRAMVDVEALTRCVIHLIKKKIITLPTI